MKKQRVLNLIKYYSEKNDVAFISEATEIAKEFDRMGDTVIAEYLMQLISSPDRYASNSNYDTLHFLQKAEYSAEPLLLPNIIEEDIKGLIRAINNESGLSKFLLYGTPGIGKTKSAYQIARLLKRDILTVPFEQLIDSRLGESAKMSVFSLKKLTIFHTVKYWCSQMKLIRQFLTE